CHEQEFECLYRLVRSSFALDSTFSPSLTSIIDFTMGLWYTFGIALFAAIGTFLFGFDTGIATTTIAHQSWIDYMNHPSKGLTGAVVAVYIAGEALGALTQTAVGDRLGRLRFMQALCVVVTIGTVIQTASVNIGMFLAGRVLAGYAVGSGLVGTVPIYLSEISSPEHRGLIGGISGCGIAFGTMMSNWVGFACSYASYGPTQWRLPLGMQVPWGVILFCGLATFMPDSPRQLLRIGKVDDARREFLKIRRDLDPQSAYQEFALMRAQIEYEVEREVKSYKEIFKLFRHRALVTTWLYGAEVLPIALRSRVMGLAAASHFIVNVGITEAGPSAFSHTSETRRKTLEEIAAAFGDKVVTLTERDIAIEEAIAEDKNVSEHVEDVSDDKRP
ncbi:putative MFS monosaccharide transporter, partial [Aureobasidium pullulans]